MKWQRAPILIIEGNIAAGKTTLAKQLSFALQLEVFYEPVEKNPYLEKFYEDPKRYALEMQMWFIRQRYDTYKQAMAFTDKTGKGVILDRSVFGDVVFAEKNFKDGNISEKGFREYLKLRSTLMKDIRTPDFTIFLEVSALTCYRRIHEVRKRVCESGIPIEYMEGLEECYTSFVESMKRLNTHVIELDWNEFGDYKKNVLPAIDEYEFVENTKPLINAPVIESLL